MVGNGAAVVVGKVVATVVVTTVTGDDEDWLVGVVLTGVTGVSVVVVRGVVP